MRPHRLLVACAHCAPALILALSSLFGPCCAFADRVRPECPASEVLAAKSGVSSGLLIVLAATEKARVEKKPKAKPQATPPGTPAPGTTSLSTSSEDESCASTCLEGCMEGTFEAIFLSIFHRDKPDTVAAVATAEPHDWNVTERGWLLAPSPGDSVALYLEPLGLEGEDVEVDRLPDGTEVVVVEIHVLPGGTELRVHPVDRVEPLGWITSTSLSARPPVKTAPAISDSTSTPPSAPQPHWAGVIAVGAGAVLPDVFVEEYEDGGLHLEARALRVSQQPLVLGGGFGFWGMVGHPQVVYQTATEIDEPFDSRLRMYSFDVSVGARKRDTILSSFIEIGPALFYVHEEANIRTYAVGDPATVIGTRVESLGRFAGGGILRTGGAVHTPSRFEFGLQISGYWMAWTGQLEKSLSTDFITGGGIYGADIALVFAYPMP